MQPGNAYRRTAGVEPDVSRYALAMRRRCRSRSVDVIVLRAGWLGCITTVRQEDKAVLDSVDRLWAATEARCGLGRKAADGDFPTWRWAFW